MAARPPIQRRVFARGARPILDVDVRDVSVLNTDVLDTDVLDANVLDTVIFDAVEPVIASRRRIGDQDASDRASANARPSVSPMRAELKLLLGARAAPAALSLPSNPSSRAAVASAIRTPAIERAPMRGRP